MLEKSLENYNPKVEKKKKKSLLKPLPALGLSISTPVKL